MIHNNTQAILKLIAYTPMLYIKSKWNQFDFAVVLAAVGGLIGNFSSGISVFRAVRVVRLIRLVKNYPVCAVFLFAPHNSPHEATKSAQSLFSQKVRYQAYIYPKT